MSNAIVVYSDGSDVSNGSVQPEAGDPGSTSVSANSDVSTDPEDALELAFLGPRVGLRKRDTSEVC